MFWLRNKKNDFDYALLSGGMSCQISSPLAVLIGPWLEKTCVFHANNKGVDQLAHPPSLVSTIAIRYLESIAVKFASCKISIF